MNGAAWAVTLAAAALTALIAGGRAGFGLFVSPLNSASGMGLAMLSLALAVGQLSVGFLQPVLGALADRIGAARLIVGGAVLLAVTTVVPALWPYPFAVWIAVLGAAVAGSAVSSNALLMGEVARAVPPARAGLAMGIVGAGASFGQLVLGPVTQWTIDAAGWSMAMIATAVFSLVAVPLALPFRRARAAAPTQPAQPVGDVLRSRRFWLVAASFGMCGFHVAFLAVHMPGVIERCGLPASLAGTWIAVAGAANIAGSIAIGFALRRYSPRGLLVGLYTVRALGIASLLVLPVTPTLMLVFALVMGASHMATLPPTSQLVAREHGVQRLGTLFGMVMLVHQAGSFAGVWFGGWAAEVTGSDTLLWCVDASLALAAAALVWPRQRTARRKVPARAERADAQSSIA